MPHEDIAIAAVSAAVNIQFHKGEFDPHSESSMQALEETARALGNVMYAMAHGGGNGEVAPVAAPAPQPVPVQAPAPVPAPQPMVNPAEAIPAAFPGTQPVNPQMVAPGAAPMVNAPPPAPGGPIGPESSDDEKWAQLVAELQQGNGQMTNWWDNRASKKSANAADFAHKTLQKPSKKTGQMWPLGLWMKNCPPWAAAIVNQYQPPQGR